MWIDLINVLFVLLGSIEERQFSGGQKKGPAIIRFLNGDTFEFNYTDGEIDGLFIYKELFILHVRTLLSFMEMNNFRFPKFYM